MFYAEQAPEAVLERIEHDAELTGRHTESRPAPAGATYRIAAEPPERGASGMLSGAADADWSPDGSLIAMVAGPALVLWDGERSIPVRQWRRASGSSMTSVRFAPDGDHVFAATRDGHIVRWNVHTGEEELLAMDVHDAHWVVDTSPRGDRLAVWQGNIVCVVDASTGDKHPCFDSVPRSDGWAHQVAFSPDGARLAVPTELDTVAIWSVTTDAEVAETGGHVDPLVLVQWSPDGRTLITGSDTGLMAWDSQTGQQISAVALPARSALQAVDVRTGRLLVRLPDDQRPGADQPDHPRLALFELIDGEPVERYFRSLLWSGSPPVRVSADGARFLAIERERVRVWSLESGRALAELKRAPPEYGYVATVYPRYYGSAVHIRSDGEGAIDQVMPEAGGTAYHGWTILPVHSRGFLDWRTRGGLMITPEPSIDVSWSASNMLRAGVRALSVGGEKYELSPRHSLYVVGGAGLAWDARGPSFRGELSLMYSRLHTARPVPQLLLPQGDHYTVEVGAALLYGSREAAEVTASFMWDPWLGAYARVGQQRDPDESRYYVVGVETGWAPTLAAAVTAGLIGLLVAGAESEQGDMMSDL